MLEATEQEVEEERRGLAQAAVAAVFAAQGLLVALALKLRIAAITRNTAAGGAAASGSLPGRRVRAGTAAYASGGGARGAAAGSPLLAGVIDQRLLDAGARVMQLDARGSAAMARLSAAGLAWMPTFANVTVLITFALALWLNFQIAGTAPTMSPHPMPRDHACPPRPPHRTHGAHACRGPRRGRRDARAAAAPPQPGLPHPADD